MNKIIKADHTLQKRRSIVGSKNTSLGGKNSLGTAVERPEKNPWAG